MQNNAKISAESRQRRHESRNPRPGWIFFSAALVVLLMACGWVGASLLILSWARSRPLDPARQSIVAPDLQPLARFPVPRLQIDPHADLLALRAHEDAELNGYGWIDRSHGVVQIPVSLAMDLIVRRASVPQTNRVTGPSSEQLIRNRALRP